MIKNIFNPGDYVQRINWALLILRVMAGAFLLTHGWGKLMNLLGPGPVQFADPIGIGMWLSLALTVFAEFFCAILVILGLGTRLAAIPLIINFAVAGFIVHSHDLFQVKEMALLYLGMFIIIGITGAGKYSVDYLITIKGKK